MPIKLAMMGLNRAPMIAEMPAPTRNQIQLCVAKNSASISNQKKPCKLPYILCGLSVPRALTRVAIAIATKKMVRLKPPKAKARAIPKMAMPPDTPLATEFLVFIISSAFL